MIHYLTSFIFIAGLLLCMWGASDRNRGVWGILALVACLMIPFNFIFLDSFESPSVHLVFCGGDLITILLISLAGMGSYKLVSWQIGCLITAMIANYMVYIDATEGTYLIYDWYELAILAIAAAQLIPGCNGVAKKLRTLGGSLFASRHFLHSDPIGNPRMETGKEEVS